MAYMQARAELVRAWRDVAVGARQRRDVKEASDARQRRRILRAAVGWWVRWVGAGKADREREKWRLRGVRRVVWCMLDRARAAAFARCVCVCV